MEDDKQNIKTSDLRSMLEVNENETIIKACIRTMIQPIPGLGSAFAQAWSEYDSLRQNQRVAEFFNLLATGLNEVEVKQELLVKNICEMNDSAELLERVVKSITVEVSDTKRMLFPKVYLHFISSPHASSVDERIDLVHHMENLSEADIGVLKKFAEQKAIRGDYLTNTVNPKPIPINEEEDDSKWLVSYGALVHSIAKLVSRGLIYTANVNLPSGHSGSNNSSFNKFRMSAWQITPLGRKLCLALG